MTLYFLDPNLTKSGGHHFDWDMLIADPVRKRGERVVVFAHRDCPASEESTLEIIPWFSHTCYDKRSTARYTGKFDDFRYFNDTLADELSALPRSRFTALDCVFVPTLTENHMLGYISWIKTFDPITAPLFVVHLMFPSGLSVRANTLTEVVDPEQALYYGLAFQRAAEPGAQIHFFGGGRQIAHEFAELSGLDIESHPIAWRPVKRLSTKAPDNPSVLLYAGDAKADKGFGLLPEITQRLATEYPTWTFLIHANEATAWDDTRRAFDRLIEVAKEFSNVRLKTGRLSRQDYDELERQADCMISTYDPVVYSRKSSGVLWESISLGLPILAPAETWMSKEAEEWGAGHMTYWPHTAEAICEQFQKFATQLGPLMERSRPAAVLYRARNGGEAIFNQFAYLWSARLAAAKLVGQPPLRNLSLETQIGAGLFYLETVDGRPVRWTGKEFNISFEWGFSSPWELTLLVGNFVGAEQVLQARAQEPSGIPLETISRIENRAGVIVVSGPGRDGKGKKTVQIILPWTYRPDGETRELGILLRDISIGPSRSLSPAKAQTNVRILSPITIGPNGEFELDRTVSGVVPLDPWDDALLSMIVRTNGDASKLRATEFYVNGAIVSLDFVSIDENTWRVSASISRSLLIRGGYATQWDIANAKAGTSKIFVHSLFFEQLEKRLGFDAKSESSGDRPTFGTDPTSKSAPAHIFMFRSVEVDEYIPGRGEYRHIGFSIYDLTDGARNWEHVKFNFCNFKGAKYLEFRNSSGWPKVFRIWPGRKEDGFGPYVKFPDPADGNQPPTLSDSRDKALMRALVGCLELIVRNSTVSSVDEGRLDAWLGEANELSQLLRGNVAFDEVTNEDAARPASVVGEAAADRQLAATPTYSVSA